MNWLTRLISQSIYSQSCTICSPGHLLKDTLAFFPLSIQKDDFLLSSYNWFVFQHEISLKFVLQNKGLSLYLKKHFISFPSCQLNTLSYRLLIFIRYRSAAPMDNNTGFHVPDREIYLSKLYWIGTEEGTEWKWNAGKTPADLAVICTAAIA